MKLAVWKKKENRNLKGLSVRIFRQNPWVSNLQTKSTMAFQRTGEAASAQIFQRDYSETCLLQGKPSAFEPWTLPEQTLRIRPWNLFLLKASPNIVRQEKGLAHLSVSTSQTRSGCSTNIAVMPAMQSAFSFWSFHTPRNSLMPTPRRCCSPPQPLVHHACSSQIIGAGRLQSCRGSYCLWLSTPASGETSRSLRGDKLWWGARDFHSIPHVAID